MNEYKDIIYLEEKEEEDEEEDLLYDGLDSEEYLLLYEENMLSSVIKNKDLELEIDYIQSKYPYDIEFIDDGNTIEINLNVEYDILYNYSANDKNMFLKYTNIIMENPISIKINFCQYLFINNFNITFKNLGILTAQIYKLSHNWMNKHHLNYIKKVKTGNYNLNNNKFDSVKEDDSLINNFIKFLISKISNFSLYCMCCGDLLEYPVFINSTCEKDICKYQSQDLGIYKNLLDIIKFDNNLFVILINLVYKTCLNKPTHLIPYPEYIFMNCENSFEKMGEYICDLIKSCPDLSSLLLKYDNNENLLIKELNLINPELYRLLKWIYNSNRSYLSYVDINEAIDLNKESESLINIFKNINNNVKCMYKVNSNTPTKEKEFQDLIKIHGKSILLFHGSKIFNWHSILRQNLINYSNTNRMENGNAYGNGIYLSNHFQTSLGYCAINYNYHYCSKKDINTLDYKTNISLKDMLNTNINIVAIVEGINNNTSDFKINNHYIVNNEKLLALRYILIV
jgi:hypothetical protein